MCQSNDVLQASFHAAPEMTRHLCDYGNGSMGYGLRKLAEEMTEDGYIHGFRDATIILSIIGLSIWGVKKLVDKHHSRKNYAPLPTECNSPEQEVSCNAEVQNTL